LDPIGKSEVFSIVSELRRDRKMTIIMVEHETEEVAKYADRVVLLREGTITASGPTQDFLSNVEGLKDTGVEPPQVTQFAHLLAQDGLISGKLPITLEDARDRITQIVQDRKNRVLRS
jgi:ABC-type multidrug transport system ATPase subunit